MNKIACLINAISFLALPWTSAAETGKHLFILSGQSNMAGVRPDESFTPTLEKEFGAGNVIVVRNAQGGQPIRRWYKNWQPKKGENPAGNGDLYDVLLDKIREAAGDTKLETLTFLWMQGERDAREGHGEVYGESLRGLIAQLSGDLGRQDINIVIGRLSDHDLTNVKCPHWSMIREIQTKFFEETPRSALVETDDLNDGVGRKGEKMVNDLHFTAEGYRIFGQRLAEAAIGLIKDGNAAESKQ
jgi:hypothetical protein